MAKKKIDHGAVIAEEHGIRRSPHWPTVEKKFKKMYPNDAAGDKKVASKDIQVHHTRPFHDVILAGRPDLELDDRNLISLSELHSTEYHLLIGHLGNFQSYNLDVRADAVKYSGWTAEQIKADPDWQKKAANRPKTWHSMTHEEQVAFRAMLDSEMPKRG